MRSLAALLALLLILAPAVRAEDEEDAEAPKPHTDAQLKEYEVHEKFEKNSNAAGSLPSSSALNAL